MGPLCSETTSARSSRPGFLMPQWMPAARNPCGAVIPRRGDAVSDLLAIFVKSCPAKSGLGIGSGSRQACLLRDAQHEVHGLNGLSCGTFHKIIQRGYCND